MLYEVITGIAQQVFQRAGDALEHRTVEFDTAAAQVEVGPFAQILRALANHPVEAVGEAVEGA